MSRSIRAAVRLLCLTTAAVAVSAGSAFAQTEAAGWLPPRVAGLTYRHLFESDEVRYVRADRERRRDGLTFLDRRVAGGGRFALVRAVSLDLSGGYAFDKIVYEGEDFGDRDQNRLNVGDGLYGAARLAIRF